MVNYACSDYIISTKGNCTASTQDWVEESLWHCPKKRFDGSLVVVPCTNWPECAARCSVEESWSGPASQPSSKASFTINSCFQHFKIKRHTTRPQSEIHSWNYLCPCALWHHQPYASLLPAAVSMSNESIAPSVNQKVFLRLSIAVLRSKRHRARFENAGVTWTSGWNEADYFQKEK